MKNWFLLILLLTVSAVLAESTPTPTPLLPGKWNAAKTPWDLWFKNNAMATDKTDYIHFFWNANDFKANFETKDKQDRLCDAALYLVQKYYPADSKTDLMKVDIVYVLQRDDYGLPKWDTMQQVAHFEFLRSKLLKNGKVPSLNGKDPNKVFDKFELY